MKKIIEIVLGFVIDSKSIVIKKKNGKPTGGVTFKSLHLSDLLASDEYKNAVADVELTINHGFKGDEIEFRDNQGYKVKHTLKQDYLYIGPDNRKEYTSADDIMADIEG